MIKLIRKLFEKKGEKLNINFSDYKNNQVERSCIKCGYFGLPKVIWIKKKIKHYCLFCDNELKEIES